MVPPITNWYTAGAKLSEISEISIAFQRGDQPEKVDHLTVEQVLEVFDTASAIVTFALASMGSQRPRRLDPRDAETYGMARKYARTMATILLRRRDVAQSRRRLLQSWLEAESHRPSIRYEYV